VPIVRGDHGVLKAILLGVWSVAASSLVAISAVEGMAAGITNTIWTMRDLLTTAL